MSHRSACLSAYLLVICCVLPMSGQEPASVNNRSNGVVPRLVNFSAVLNAVNGKPLTSITGVTFFLYRDEQGGAPLWMETQNVQPDRNGHYTVMLGSTTSTGLPADIFVAGEAGWLGVQPQGQAEQPRVPLLSVPYALKAADAQTIGGLPPSAFVRTAGPTFQSAGSGTITGVIAGRDLTGGGTSGTVTLNLDVTKVPQLATANTFTGNQTVNGNVSATGRVAGSAYNIGSDVFAFGSASFGNAYLGFAGNTNTTGTAQNNTATGFKALAANTMGIDNTADGYSALTSNIGGLGDGGFVNIGAYNTASGYYALKANTVGNYNTAMGFYALASNIGSLNGGTFTGWANTAIGSSALTDNTTGNDNTASGWQALLSNTSGNDNTADGQGALQSNTMGGSNTAVGALALSKNASGILNSAVGILALDSNTLGFNNTATGGSALGANTTGNDNTAVGGSALASNSSGSENTCIGNACDVSTGSLTNATAIGAFAHVGASNALVLGSIKGVGGAQSNTKVGIGTTTPTRIFTIGKGFGHAIADGWDTYSSRRWKTNIQTLHGALEKVEQLRGVSYDLKANGKHEVGVIAEEVGSVVPEVVTWEENGKDAQSVDYSRLTALLIEATKEQQVLIHEQKEQISAQQAQITRLTRQVRTIQATLKTNGRSGSEVRTVKAVGTRVHQ